MGGMLRTFLLVLMTASAMSGQAAGDWWKPLGFLIGDWVGVAGAKDTPIGAGQGAFSFAPDVERKVIVRRNKAQYDSGARHDDLMVIYMEDARPRAIYFDSEGHVIHYSVSTPSAERVVFESDAGYRLTYWMEDGAMKGQFEVGGKPYMNWTSRRQGGQ